MIDRVKMELQDEFSKYKRADSLMFLTGKKRLITYIVEKKMKQLYLRTNLAICYGILMTVLLMMIFVKKIFIQIRSKNMKSNQKHILKYFQNALQDIIMTIIMCYHRI